MTQPELQRTGGSRRLAASRSGSLVCRGAGSHARRRREAQSCVVAASGRSARRRRGAPDLSKGLGSARRPRHQHPPHRLSRSCRAQRRRGDQAAISPTARSGRGAEEIGAFVGYYVKARSTSASAATRRGLYARALAGENPAVTASRPLRRAAAPELVIDTEREELADSASRVIDQLFELGHCGARAMLSAAQVREGA